MALCNTWSGVGWVSLFVFPAWRLILDKLGFVSLLNNMAYLVQEYVRSAEAWPPDGTILTSWGLFDSLASEWCFRSLFSTQIFWVCLLVGSVWVGGDPKDQESPLSDVCQDELMSSTVRTSGRYHVYGKQSWWLFFIYQSWCEKILCWLKRAYKMSDKIRRWSYWDRGKRKSTWRLGDTLDQAAALVACPLTAMETRNWAELTPCS